MSYFLFRSIVYFVENLYFGDLFECCLGDSFFYLVLKTYRYVINN